MKRKIAFEDRTIWEVLVWPKRTPYWIYWLTIALTALIVGVAGSFYYGEDVYFITGACLAFLNFIIPTYIIYSSHKFRELFTSLEEILWRSRREFESWHGEMYARAFLLKSRLARTCIVIFPIVAYGFAFSIGLPFQHAIPNVVGLTLVLPLLLAGAHASYILLYLLWLLREVTTRKANVPFGTTLYVETSKLYGYYLHTGTIITVSYAALALGVFRGPFVSIFIVIGLSALALYPIAYFSWSSTQIHNLMLTAKLAHARHINRLVEKKFRETASSAAARNIEQLNRLTEVQLRIQSQKEWPFDVYSLAPFGAALLTAIVQGILVLKNLSVAPH